MSDSLKKDIMSNILVEMPKSKQEKIKRIYEDDNFVIDLFAEDMVRVSIFTNGHFVDEVFVRKEDYDE